VDGNAARVFGRLTVVEAKEWAVIKSRFMSEYGLPRHEAWRLFKQRKLGPDEPVDVYIDALLRLGARVDLDSELMAFKAQFYEGLSLEDYEWAITRSDAFTASWVEVQSRVRERIAARRSIRRHRNDVFHGGTAAVSSAKLGCYRCEGDHLVRDCASRKQSRSRSRPQANQLAQQVGARKQKAEGRKPIQCFRCRQTGHRARDCMVQMVAAATETREHESDFLSGRRMQSISLI
jgi:hypothetical protein